MQFDAQTTDAIAIDFNQINEQTLSLIEENNSKTARNQIAREAAAWYLQKIEGNKDANPESIKQWDATIVSIFGALFRSRVNESHLRVIFCNTFIDHYKNHPDMVAILYTKAYALLAETIEDELSLCANEEVFKSFVNYAINNFSQIKLDNAENLARYKEIVADFVKEVAGKDIISNASVELRNFNEFIFGKMTRMSDKSEDGLFQKHFFMWAKYYECLVNANAEKMANLFRSTTDKKQGTDEFSQEQYGKHINLWGIYGMKWLQERCEKDAKKKAFAENVIEKFLEFNMYHEAASYCDFIVKNKVFSDKDLQNQFTQKFDVYTCLYISNSATRNFIPSQDDTSGYERNIKNHASSKYKEGTAPYYKFLAISYGEAACMLKRISGMIFKKSPLNLILTNFLNNNSKFELTYEEKQMKGISERKEHKQILTGITNAEKLLPTLNNKALTDCKLVEELRKISNDNTAKDNYAGMAGVELWKRYNEIIGLLRSGIEVFEENEMTLKVREMRELDIKLTVQFADRIKNYGLWGAQKAEEMCKSITKNMAELKADSDILASDNNPDTTNQDVLRIQKFCKEKKEQLNKYREGCEKESSTYIDSKNYTQHYKSESSSYTEVEQMPPSKHSIDAVLKEQIGLFSKYTQAASGPLELEQNTQSRACFFLIKVIEDIGKRLGSKIDEQQKQAVIGFYGKIMDFAKQTSLYADINEICGRRILYLELNEKTVEQIKNNCKYIINEAQKVGPSKSNANKIFGQADLSASTCFNKNKEDALYEIAVSAFESFKQAKLISQSESANKFFKYTFLIELVKSLPSVSKNSSAEESVNNLYKTILKNIGSDGEAYLFQNIVNRCKNEIEQYDKSHGKQFSQNDICEM